MWIWVAWLVKKSISEKITRFCNTFSAQLWELYHFAFEIPQVLVELVKNVTVGIKTLVLKKLFCCCFNGKTLLFHLVLDILQGETNFNYWRKKKPDWATVVRGLKPCKCNSVELVCLLGVRIAHERDYPSVLCTYIIHVLLLFRPA